MTHDPPFSAVRAATSADIPAVLGILFAALDAGELAGTERYDLDNLLDLMRVDASGMLVSATDDEVTRYIDPGYPLLAVHPRHRRQRHATRLVEHTLATIREQGLPDYRGPGLGRELLRWGVQHLRSRGATSIVLAVDARNTHALTIYEHTG